MHEVQLGFAALRHHRHELTVELLHQEGQPLRVCTGRIAESQQVDDRASELHQDYVVGERA